MIVLVVLALTAWFVVSVLVALMLAAISGRCEDVDELARQQRNRDRINAAR